MKCAIPLKLKLRRIKIAVRENLLLRRAREAGRGGREDERTVSIGRSI